ncbi:LLM class flavin-dependent oxidoreductase [Leucobacter triazinivorans]|uniref:LLM class flavin-dependent oxidoreductase n=1 Tax=Leucobacter triazinivorans TaxID=1784719 RepID=A0A4P6KF78_9MICO|nr:LLM class flavin-dependent oxidoreductase [Leucobacter triazinivorans]QBE48893.1 LLM class flavin-dependent oxidoreductase [Leucobacter triazinivorans]QBE50011.1 LLM class flavin-dependent oxidoreductase [Leucobacter triazinivorans]HCU76934.1 LLM class flavin-dependent oxidoreductase [Microbacterium sp.]|tara:strand:- start:1961 stop:3007 length:1047 start_codon:yes stop_codon:yes gene_type:complete
MTFELGAYSFGVAGKNLDGDVVSTAQAVRNMLEQIRLAEQVGLDFYGVGEHHTATMPVSSPASVINAAAAMTNRITLSTAVSVLSTDDPIRLYQQMATAQIVSNGRVEIIAGRGSSTDSFPLFGYELDDYDRLYADKLGLLLAIGEHERVSWESPFRPPLEDALVVPRPDQPIPIWLGTGGNPGSTVRAAKAGLPISYGILSGTPQRWGQMGALYRQAAEESGVDPSQLAISVAGHGFIAADGQAAKQTFFRHESAAYAAHGRFAALSWEDAKANYSPGGMVFAGDPSEIADRIIDLHRHLGHMRHFFQMDIGGMPHSEVLASIELLGTEVAPRVRAEIGSDGAAPSS